MKEPDATVTTYLSEVLFLNRLDAAVTAYLKKVLLLKGGAVSSARAAVFGVIWARGLPEVASWSLNKSLQHLKDEKELDAAVTSYLNEVPFLKGLDAGVTACLNEVPFLKGEAVSSARATGFGAIRAHGPPKQRTTLPRTRCALSGYAREQPAHAEGPVPIAANAVIASKLLDDTGPLQQLGGLAMLVDFDLFT